MTAEIVSPRQNDVHVVYSLVVTIGVLRLVAVSGSAWNSLFLQICRNTINGVHLVMRRSVQLHSWVVAVDSTPGLATAGGSTAEVSTGDSTAAPVATG